jgi:hypothetical protein
MGNNTIRFGIFNQYNQVYDHYLVKKEMKDRALEKARKHIMNKGFSLAVNDMTVS